MDSNWTEPDIWFGLSDQSVPGSAFSCSSMMTMSLLRVLDSSPRSDSLRSSAGSTIDARIVDHGQPCNFLYCLFLVHNLNATCESQICVYSATIPPFFVHKGGCWTGSIDSTSAPSASHIGRGHSLPSSILIIFLQLVPGTSSSILQQILGFYGPHRRPCHAEFLS